MSEWIELNLPYIIEVPYFKLPIKQPQYPFEEVEAKMLEKFGETYCEALDNGDNELAEEIRIYSDDLDCVIEYNKTSDDWFDYVHETLPSVSFYHSSYNKPGTLIEVLDNGELKKLLIGHGKAQVVGQNAVVVRCKVLDIDYD
jgi:hypothetical protein